MTSLAAAATVGANDNVSVREVLDQAHAELQQLLAQRAEVMRKIGTVKQTISGLAKMFGEGALSAELLQLLDRKSGGRHAGFTKTCRMILMEAKRPLTSREMCQRLAADAPQILERHKDPTASVTTVLNRLLAYGEAKTTTIDGRRAWQWVSDSEFEVPAALPRAS